jgi:hypothetical protein
VNEYQHVINELREEAEEIKKADLKSLAAGYGVDVKRMGLAALLRSAADCLQEAGDELEILHG